MHKVLAAQIIDDQATDLGAWDSDALDALKRKIRELSKVDVGRVIVAPAGYFKIDADQPSPRVAALFWVPNSVSNEGKGEHIVVVSHEPFEMPIADSLIWGVRDRAELEQFWDNFPFVRATHNLIVFMVHPTLGVAVSHSAFGHAHTLLALRFVQEMFSRYLPPLPVDYPHLPRGRIHVHITTPTTITFSTERDRRIDPNYRTFRARIRQAVNTLHDLGLHRNAKVRFHGNTAGEVIDTTVGALLARHRGK
jgi:hypothetical protein